MKRFYVVLLALSVLIGACSQTERGEWGVGPTPSCDTTSKGRLILIAQSVPGASLIPCIGDLPPGWDFTDAFSESGKSRLTFTTDTFDLDVDVVLTAGCDVSSARETDSPESEARLFSARNGKAFFFVFPGGCAAFEYETAQLAGSAEGQALLEAISFMTRDTLRERSGWTL